ncbi:unnamed protein product [Amoebophrya sp. A120]|nr:unnamed protein product [Amoebophrya sp. A120]|eukprot:GSA120T00004223001.1
MARFYWCRAHFSPVILSWITTFLLLNNPALPTGIVSAHEVLEKVVFEVEWNAKTGEARLKLRSPGPAPQTDELSEFSGDDARSDDASFPQAGAPALRAAPQTDTVKEQSYRLRKFAAQERERLEQTGVWPAVLEFQILPSAVTEEELQRRMLEEKAQHDLQEQICAKMAGMAVISVPPSEQRRAEQVVPGMPSAHSVKLSSPAGGSSPDMSAPSCSSWVPSAELMELRRQLEESQEFPTSIRVLRDVLSTAVVDRSKNTHRTNAAAQMRKHQVGREAESYSQARAPAPAGQAQVPTPYPAASSQEGSALSSAGYSISYPKLRLKKLGRRLPLPASPPRANPPMSSSLSAVPLETLSLQVVPGFFGNDPKEFPRGRLREQEPSDLVDIHLLGNGWDTSYAGFHRKLTYWPADGRCAKLRDGHWALPSAFRERLWDYNQEEFETPASEEDRERDPGCMNTGPVHRKDMERKKKKLLREWAGAKYLTFELNRRVNMCQQTLDAARRNLGDLAAPDRSGASSAEHQPRPGRTAEQIAVLQSRKEEAKTALQSAQTELQSEHTRLEQTPPATQWDEIKRTLRRSGAPEALRQGLKAEKEALDEALQTYDQLLQNLAQGLVEPAYHIPNLHVWRVRKVSADNDIADEVFEDDDAYQKELAAQLQQNGASRLAPFQHGNEQLRAIKETNTADSLPPLNTSEGTSQRVIPEYASAAAPVPEGSTHPPEVTQERSGKKKNSFSS